MDWDLLRTFETVVRLGTLTRASGALGVSQSTVSRQLAQLEQQAGSPLLMRGPVRLTERGQAVLQAMRPMLDAALATEAALEATPELRGQVTVATVAELVRWVLLPELPDFFEAHPELRLRLLADNQMHSLAAGEADISLRLVRPTRGELVGRKIHVESYGLFSAHNTVDAETPWLGLSGSLAMIPEQRHAEVIFAERPPRLLVEDVESLGMAVAAGLGVAVLPRGLARRFDLHEVSPQVGGRRRELPDRAMWLVVHQSKQHIPRVRVVIEWITEVFDQLREVGAPFDR